jgi:hypothetical protein
MKATIIALALVSALFLGACGASADSVSTSIAATLQISQLETAAAGGVAAATSAAVVTDTPTPTETQQSSATPTATNTNQPTNTATITATDTPSGPPPLSFAGHWYTNSGTMDIVQSQRDFTGSLYDAITNKSYAISGSIAGNQLTEDSGLSLTVSADGLTVFGKDQMGNELCGALAGHHFPMGCSFAGIWTTYREPTSSCDNTPLTLVREDMTVSGVYCGGRTIEGTVSYTPSGFFKVIMNGQFLGADGSTFYSLFFGIEDYAADQFRGSWDQGRWPFCGWQAGTPDISPIYCLAN